MSEVDLISHHRYADGHWGPLHVDWGTHHGYAPHRHTPNGRTEWRKVIDMVRPQKTERHYIVDGRKLIDTLGLEGCTKDTEIAEITRGSNGTINIVTRDNIKYEVRT